MRKLIQKGSALVSFFFFASDLSSSGYFFANYFEYILDFCFQKRLSSFWGFANLPPARFKISLAHFDYSFLNSPMSAIVPYCFSS